MKDVINWIKDYFISIFLPIICIIAGITLLIFGAAIGDMFNQNIGSILFLFGAVLFFSGLALPVYFFIKSLFFSIKDLSSNDSSRKISGILGIILLVIFILSLRDYVFNMSGNVITALIILLVVSFAFLIVLMLIIKMLYLIVSSLIRFLTGLRGKK